MTINFSAPQTQAPLMDSTALTPQQKLAMALMQNQQQQVNPNGAWSPSQGANSLFQDYLAGQMMQKAQQQQQMNGALQAANMSSDPIGALAQRMNWTPGDQ